MKPYVSHEQVAENIRPLVPVANRPPRFTRESFQAIEPRGAEWLVKNLIPAHGYGFLAGPSQGGKSFLSLEWSLRLSAGLDVLDHRSPRAGVVYVASEGANGVRKRVAAWRQSNPGVSCAFELIGQAPDLRKAEDISDLIAELHGAAEELAGRGDVLGLVVIDTLAASMPGGNENDGADMSALLANIQRIGEETMAFVLVVSHTGKDEGRGLRGWSGQFAGADTVIMLTREEGADLRVGLVKKQKDGEDGERFAFRLEKVVLGEDGDGDEISSAVVVYDGVPEAKTQKAARPTADGQFLLKAIRYVTDNGDTVPAPRAPGVLPHQLAVTRRDVRARAFASGFAHEEEKPNSTTKRFGRAIEDLVAKSAIRVEEDLLWLL